MEIFLSAEIEGPVTSKWFELQKNFTEKLLQLNNRSYGDCLNSIGIISIILREDFFIEGGYKERKYYSFKKKEADIRLRIDYKEFSKGDDAKRKEMYILHILEAIKIAGNRAGKEFDVSSLLFDVEKMLRN